jgi:hypothetical protein
MTAAQTFFRSAKVTKGFTWTGSQRTRLLSKGNPLDAGPGSPAPDERYPDHVRAIQTRGLTMNDQ